MNTPKLILRSLAAILCAGSVHAAGVLYSFESAAPNGTYTLNASVVAGFLGASAVTRTGSGNTGGEASFTDFQGTVWTGSGGSTGAGNSLAWTGGGANLTGSFSITLNTSELTDLNVRLAVRAAGTGATSSFSSFTYDVGGGAQAIATPLGFTAGSTFSTWTADLSSIGALSNKESVTLTWSFANNISGTSLRVDNIQITAVAIPEPSTYAALIGVAALGVVLVHRRKTIRE
jgi:hypothetical protein